MRSFILGLVMLCVSLGISLGLAEVGTRIVYPGLVPSGQLRFTPASGDIPVLGPKNETFRQVKNTGDFDVTVKFNRLGFRDDRDVSKGTADDLYLIGDSLAFGWGVEARDRLSERLEDILHRKVFNIAMPTGIEQFDLILRYAARQGAEIGHVILLFSMETAIQRDNPGNSGKPARPAHPISRLKQYLMTHSAFYFLVTSFVHKNPTLKKWAVQAGLLIPNLEGISFRPYSAKAVADTARRIAGFAKEHPLTVVIAPSRALWYGSPAERAETLRTHTEFIAALQARGIKPIDLKPTFEAGGHPLGYFFKNDGHWSPRGHALAAKVIASRLAGQ